MRNGQQRAEMERDMCEEHRKDPEAFERLKRFLPKNDIAPAPSPLSGLRPENIDGEFVDTTNDLTEFLYQREV